MYYVLLVYIGLCLGLLFGLSCEELSSSEYSMLHIICARMSSVIVCVSCSLASLARGGELGHGWAPSCPMDAVCCALC